MVTSHQFLSHDGSHYIITFEMKKGERGTPFHKHSYPHDLFVAKGTVRLDIGTLNCTLHAPDNAQFPTGAVHSFVCMSDECFCVATHPADAADADEEQ